MIFSRTYLLMVNLFKCLLQKGSGTKSNVGKKRESFPNNCIAEASGI